LGIVPLSFVIRKKYKHWFTSWDLPTIITCFNCLYRLRSYPQIVNLNYRSIIIIFNLVKLYNNTSSGIRNVLYCLLLH
jgi:hypothetical protein